MESEKKSKVQSEFPGPPIDQLSLLTQLDVEEGFAGL